MFVAVFFGQPGLRQPRFPVAQGNGHNAGRFVTRESVRRKTTPGPNYAICYEKCMNNYYFPKSLGGSVWFRFAASPLQLIMTGLWHWERRLALTQWQADVRCWAGDVGSRGLQRNQTATARTL